VQVVAHHEVEDEVGRLVRMSAEMLRQAPEPCCRPGPQEEDRRRADRLSSLSDEPFHLG
jgi:hypothetical protein